MMNGKNYKILFSLSISLVIAITSLLFVLNYYPSTTFQEIETNTFFNKDFDINEKKIMVSGNTVIDALLLVSDKIDDNKREHEIV